MSGRWNQTLLLLLELPSELMDQLILLLDNKVLGLVIREEWVVIIVGIGPVMGLM